MAIAATDILHMLSTTAGAAGNVNTGTPAGSLGKYVSTTQMGATLFDDVSGAENAANAVDYRCFFVKNNHATLTAYSVTCYVTEVAGGANIAIGVDPTAASAAGSASVQAVTIANETTAPAGVTFSTPTTDGTGIALGDLTPGQVRAVWVRRTATNSASLSGDGFTPLNGFDTP